MIFFTVLSISVLSFSQQDTSKIGKNGILFDMGVNFAVKYKQGLDQYDKYYTTPGFLLGWRHQVYSKENFAIFAGAGMWYNLEKYDTPFYLKKLNLMYVELPVSFQYVKKRFVLEGGIGLKFLLHKHEVTLFNGCWIDNNGNEECNMTGEVSYWVMPWDDFSKNTGIVLYFHPGYYFTVSSKYKLQIAPEIKWSVGTLYDLTHKTQYVVEPSKYMYLFSGLKFIGYW